MYMASIEYPAFRPFRHTWRYLDHLRRTERPHRGADPYAGEHEAV